MLLKAALYMISNFVLVDRVQSMAGMSISVGVETRKTGKNLDKVHALPVFLFGEKMYAKYNKKRQK